MKNFPKLGLVIVVTFASVAALTPVLRAQVPPPPEQLDPSDPNMAPDQGAPDQNAPDQGAPDQGDQVSFQTFYDDLGSQGTWMQTDNYGYVWQPNVQDPDWRPYSNGNWVYTDDGWTWVADQSEPWGWATYHYGRWTNLDGVGWVWVPGYTWAPAWVSWRYGGGYCGWAPLPPETSVGIDFGDDDNGFHIGGDCDTAYDIGPGCYNFVPIIYFGARDYRPYYLNRYNNYAAINRTRNVTNIVVGSGGGANRFGRVTVGGPNFTTVNAQSRTPVQRASLVSSHRVGNGSLQGNRLTVFAPQVSATPTARPRTVAASFTAASVNRGTDINRPLTVSSRLAPAPASPQQIQAAHDAQARAPRTAGIATTSTQLASPLTTPLTAMQPRPSRHKPSIRRRRRIPAKAFTGGNSGNVHHTQSQNPNFTPAPHHDVAPVQHTQTKPSIRRRRRIPAKARLPAEIRAASITPKVRIPTSLPPLIMMWLPFNIRRRLSSPREIPRRSIRFRRRWSIIRLFPNRSPRFIPPR